MFGDRVRWYVNQLTTAAISLGDYNYLEEMIL